MPYLVTVIVYIGISNIIGLFGMKPPTKDLNVTGALAIMSIILIEYSGIHAKGVKRWGKSFASPVAVASMTFKCIGDIYQTIISMYATFR